MPYSSYIKSLLDLTSQYKAVQTPPTSVNRKVEDPQGTVLIFSPHPDDECIIGAAALKFQDQAKYRIVNVAVTHGSDKARQAARLEELKGACTHLGFELHCIGDSGLEDVKPSTRENAPEEWAEKLAAIKDILEHYNPDCIIYPHEKDWNGTHIGVFHLLRDALALMGPEFTTRCLESEYWGGIYQPNLMIELSEDDVSLLINALAFHVGEIERNPYHVTVPLFMMDAVRRGAELIGGQGGAAPDFQFATIYNHGTWANGGFTQAESQILSKSDSFE